MRDRFWRRLFTTLVLVIAFLVVSSGANAEKRDYAAISSEQAEKIEAVIRAEQEYRHGVIIAMKNVFWQGTKIMCWIRSPDEYAEFVVYLNGEVRLRVSWQPALAAAERVQGEIKKIINPPNKKGG
jgi:hypothetical protein